MPEVDFVFFVFVRPQPSLQFVSGRNLQTKGETLKEL